MAKKSSDRKMEIVQAARGLFYTQGYESVSVQQIIDAVGIAKGTFYHYFSSKEDLLDAMVDFMLDAMMPMLQAIKENPDLPATEKLKEVFASAKSWKQENVDMVFLMMKQLYREENILMRTKMNRKSLALIIPLFGDIIREGNKSREFSCEYPEESAEFIMAIAMGAAEIIVKQLQELDSGTGEAETLLNKIDRHFKAIDRAIERLVGLERDSLTVYGDVVSSNFIDAFMQGGKA